MSTNITTPVVLPPGTVNHGDPNLICFPAKWSDILVFFLGNYLTHVGTVLIAPGTPVRQTALSLLGALLFPGIGVSRGVHSILSGAIFAPTDLQTAAKSGALCRVVREDEWARSPRELNLTDSQNSSFLDQISHTKIHGRVRLPKGYCLALVRPDACFVDDEKTSKLPTVVKSEYNVVKILITLVQLGFSITTLYRARGDQINEFGFAAFGLTVTPYAVMSLVNLIGSFIRPQYTSVYLVQSELMLEAAQQPDAVFEGYVGILDEDETDPERDRRLPEPMAAGVGAVWLPVFLIPLATTMLIIGLMSHFRSGNSTLWARALILAWLAFGGFFGVLGGRAADLPRPNRGPFASKWTRRILTGATVLAMLPLVGGAVWVVISEILSFGNCTRTN